MSKMIRAAVMMGPGRMEMGEVPMPEPKDNEVLVKIKHVGICGADLEFFKDGFIGGWVLEFPHVLGHEPAGIVAGFGKDVKGLKEGDAVSIEPGKTCGNCEFCNSGLYNLCPDVKFMSVPGATGATGAFQDYVAWPSNRVFKLPEGVSTLEGALVEPLSVGFHAVNQSGAKFGDSAVIIGAGCIGLCTLLALRARGITDVYMSDLAKVRMEKAKQLGAKEVFDVSKVNLTEKITALTNGRGVNMVYECTGVSKSVNQGIELMAKGGTLTLIGLFGEANIPVDLNGLIFREGTFKSNFRYRHIYPVAIKALAAGIVPLKDIVSHKFKLEELGKALKLNTEHKDEVTKVVIEL
jgi:L-iditol 2-dehydrogenase